jgi:hypothetical protein
MNDGPPELRLVEDPERLDERRAEAWLELHVDSYAGLEPHADYDGGLELRADYEAGLEPHADYDAGMRTGWTS